MDGLLSLLLFAGLFYLMMRFGCGAHMVHGHHHGHGHRSHKRKPHKDPVCGMEVAPDQGYRKIHNGQQFHFCSRACLDKFDAHPERYLDRTGGKS